MHHLKTMFVLMGMLFTTHVIALDKSASDQRLIMTEQRLSGAQKTISNQQRQISELTSKLNQLQKQMNSMQSRSKSTGAFSRPAAAINLKQSPEYNALLQRVDKLEGTGTSATPVPQANVLKVGNNSIEVTASGILIKGANIQIQSDRDVDVRAGTDVKLEGGKSMDLKAGLDVNMKAGTKIKAEAGNEAEVKSGALIKLNTTQVKVGSGSKPAARMNDSIVNNKIIGGSTSLLLP